MSELRLRRWDMYQGTGARCARMLYTKSLVSGALLQLRECRALAGHGALPQASKRVDLVQRQQSFPVEAV